MTALSEPDRAWLRPELVVSWWEMGLVALCTAGLAIGFSAWNAWHGSSTHYVELLLSDDQLITNVAQEAALLGLLLVYLHRRGWRPPDLAIRVGVFNSALGLGLFFVTEILAIITVLTLLVMLFVLTSHHVSFLQFLTAHSPQMRVGTIHLHWLTIFTSMILNAYVEEIIFMAYIFRQVAARWGAGRALLLTIALRAGCHTYQDGVHLAAIAVVFTAYALVYIRWRALWPLIFAHLLLDIGSTSVVKLLYGG